MGSFEIERQEHEESTSSVLGCVATNYSCGGSCQDHHDGTSTNSLVSFQSEECQNEAAFITSPDVNAPDSVSQGIFLNDSSMRGENMTLDGLDGGDVSNTVDEFALDWTLPFKTEQLVEDDLCLGSLLHSVLDEAVAFGSVPV